MWRYGGALNDVLVVSGEDVRVQDLNIESCWKWDSNAAALDIFVDILNMAAKPGEDLIVSAIIQDPEGALVHTKSSRLLEQIDCLDLRRNQQAHLSALVPAPLLWSKENQALYSILLTLETRSGYIYDAVATDFGVRRPTPHAYEILNVHQKIWIEALENKPGIYRINNQFDYLSLTSFEPCWELFKDGQSVATGTLAPLEIGPREQGTLHIPKLPRMPYKGHEMVLKISFHLMESTPWAARGHCVAQSQFNLVLCQC